MTLAELRELAVVDLTSMAASPNHAAHVRRLAQSIAAEGLREPLMLVRWAGRLMLGEGHHRLLALESLGWTSVPVAVLPLTAC